MQLMPFCLLAKGVYQSHLYVGRCNTLSVLHLDQRILRYFN